MSVFWKEFSKQEHGWIILQYMYCYTYRIHSCRQQKVCSVVRSVLFADMIALGSFETNCVLYFRRQINLAHHVHSLNRPQILSLRVLFGSRDGSVLFAGFGEHICRGWRRNERFK